MFACSAPKPARVVTPAPAAESSTEPPAEPTSPICTGYSITTSALGPSDVAGAVFYKSAQELAALSWCNASDVDFTTQWIASFTLVSDEGAFNPVALRDDGTTLTLDVAFSRRCPGVSPATGIGRFAYLVPARERKLATHVTVAKAHCPPAP